MRERSRAKAVSRVVEDPESQASQGCQGRLGDVTQDELEALALEGPPLNAKQNYAAENGGEITTRERTEIKSDESADGCSELRIAITTDNHLGVKERDPIRRDDSFRTFEESLRMGMICGADVVLQAGDLFDIQRPSQFCILRTMQIIKRVCAVPRPRHPGISSIKHDRPSKQAARISTIRTSVSPSIEVVLPDVLGREYAFETSGTKPFFMIHGNHDPPTYSGVDACVSPVDLLSAADLVDNIGNYRDVNDIVVRPTVIRKGETIIALYGFGNIREERAHRMFTLGKIRFLTPTEHCADFYALKQSGQIPGHIPATAVNEGEYGEKDWEFLADEKLRERLRTENVFNILMIHQNRYRGAMNGLPAKSCVLEEMLPEWMDLVIWGHEHDCEIEPVRGSNHKYFLSQPGSTVVTSLRAGEAIAKRNAIVTVRKRRFNMVSFPLLSVRPFVFRDVTFPGIPASDNDSHLSSHNPRHLRSVILSRAAMEDKLRREIEQALEEAKEVMSERNRDWWKTMKKLFPNLNTMAALEIAGSGADAVAETYSVAAAAINDARSSLEEKVGHFHKTYFTNSMLPLIRLRAMVPANSEELLLSRLNTDFCETVCNCDEMVLVHKAAWGKRGNPLAGVESNAFTAGREGDGNEGGGSERGGSGAGPSIALKRRAEGSMGTHELIFNYVNSDAKHRCLDVMLEQQLNQATIDFVEKYDTHAFEDLVLKRLEFVEKTVGEKLDAMNVENFPVESPQQRSNAGMAAAASSSKAPLTLEAALQVPVPSDDCVLDIIRSLTSTERAILASRRDEDKEGAREGDQIQRQDENRNGLETDIGMKDIVPEANENGSSDDEMSRQTSPSERSGTASNRRAVSKAKVKAKAKGKALAKGRGGRLDGPFAPVSHETREVSGRPGPEPEELERLARKRSLSQKSSETDGDSFAVAEPYVDPFLQNLNDVP